MVLVESDRRRRGHVGPGQAGDMARIREAIRLEAEEHGRHGRMASWPVSVSMTVIEAAADLAVQGVKGEIRVNDAGWRPPGRDSCPPGTPLRSVEGPSRDPGGAIHRSGICASSTFPAILSHSILAGLTPGS
jgi:hypothetical protein